MGLLSRLRRLLAPPTEVVEEHPAERFYHTYTGRTSGEPAVDEALRSQWTAHYIIYRLFLDEPALKVPTLDICSGSGAGTKLLATETGCEVIGIDYSNEAIAYATKNNPHEGVSYLQLDLTREQDIERIRSLVQERGIRQAFFIEGIEHLPPDTSNALIGMLLDAGVERICISTPYEKPAKEAEIHHITPFTPDHFAEFAQRWNATVFRYLKFIDVDDLNAFIDAGNDEKATLAQFSTDDAEQAGSYLIRIG